MKKLLFIFILLLAGCETFHTQERFVNPIFYQPMYSKSPSMKTWLTPTKIYSEEIPLPPPPPPKDENEEFIREFMKIHGPDMTVIGEKTCRLIKNTQTMIEFMCDFNHPKKGGYTNEFHRYTIIPHEDSDGERVYIRHELMDRYFPYCIPENEQSFNTCWKE